MGDGHVRRTLPHRSAVTTAYTDNVVNEYMSIEDVPSGLGPVNVTYDNAGNLVVDERGHTYSYDYDNRLISVRRGSTQVASFEYDALGRLISTQVRYDVNDPVNGNGKIETLKYYYDGQNVIAEYDMADNLSRKYIHGTSRIDERAVLIEGSGQQISESPIIYDIDTYYYLVQELDTVTGLITVSGTLAEAYTYDAYANVSLWGYLPVDFNRDGDVDYDDQDEWFEAFNSTPPTDPVADANSDGTVDTLDWSYLSIYFTGDGEPPATLYTSALGNPYFFTGRKMHFFETLFSSDPELPEPNQRVQYNRARHYDPLHGRWLQRDPALYVDGMNLYEYVRSNPSKLRDSQGLWGVDVHRDLTAIWAYQVGMKRKAARKVGEENFRTDYGTTGWRPYPFRGDQSRHFNRQIPGWGYDTRLEWLRLESMRAKEACRPDRDNPRRAAGHLGRALHSVQDWWAHGDYSAGPDGVWVPHLSVYDRWGLDAVGSFQRKRPIGGRPPQVFRIDPGSPFRYEIPWPYWDRGNLRQRGTEQSTREAIESFLAALRGQGGCACKKYFLR